MDLTSPCFFSIFKTNIMEENSSFRIIDANLNRLTEGLRVLEEAVRFLFGDTGLTVDLKEVRQMVAETVRDSLLYKSLLQSRDIATDPGSSASFDKGNPVRESLGDLMRANFQRTKESVRVIEEYSKLLDGKAEAFKTIRFKLYDIEKNVMLRYFSSEEKR
jgi:thiamine-phosphate pyrophosphorylase